MTKSRPYAELGKIIASARSHSGFANQADLAAALGIKQQSISRWESGANRPGVDQLGALAKLLRLSLDRLRQMAGYDVVPAATYIAPLPLEGLGPDEFEQFTRDLVQRLRPDWRVRRAGGTGHTQNGVDVYAVAPDGAESIFQCKKVAQFGPANALAAINAYQGPAAEKVLVLSRVASPETARVVEAQPGWAIWDRDDLSARLRSLPPEQQDKLVDIYFRGQRLALLGRSEPGPWLTAEEFFRPFLRSESLFNHAWNLIGRDEQTAQLRQILADEQRVLTILSGAGGMGKSRLLHEVVEAIAKAEPLTVIRFLSNASNPTRELTSLLGPGPKIIIVDDAHDRDGLDVLFEYAADPTTQTRLLLASRPYAVGRIRQRAAVAGLIDPVQIDLPPLTKAELKGLAEQALVAHDAPIAWADDVVQISGGSPLIVTIAAQTLARQPMATEKLRSQTGLRDLVLGKFKGVITGEAWGAGDAVINRDILQLLALVQPFHPEDAGLIGLAEKITRHTPHEIEAAFRKFVVGGVVFRRGHQHRLMPDVLSDYLVDETCLTAESRLTRYAEDVLRAAPAKILQNVLVNLGRLDWRQRDGDTANSRLLENVWRQFDEIASPHDERLDAIAAVALFQPRQALAFVSRRVASGEAWPALTDILRNVAYSGQSIREIAELLWELSKGEQEPRDNPSPPVQALIEIGGFDDRKPRAINEAILAFSLDCADLRSNWAGSQTPLMLLKPFLSAEGVKTRASNREVTITRYIHRYEVVRPYRAAVIAKLVDLVRSDDPRIARLAASAMGDALRPPLLNVSPEVAKEFSEPYEAEFSETLETLRAMMITGLPASTTLTLASSIKWLARRGSESGERAQAVLDALPTDLGFRTRSALFDGYGSIFIKESLSDGRGEKAVAWVESIAADITSSFPDPAARRLYVGSALEELSAAGHSLNSAFALGNALLRQDAAFADAVVEDAETTPTSATARFAASALSTVLRHDPPQGRQIARRWLGLEATLLRRSVPAAYGGEGDLVGADDLSIMREALNATDEHVVIIAIHTLLTWRQVSPATLVDLALSARVEGSSAVLDEVSMLVGGADEALAALTEDHAAAYLASAKEIPELSGHWIDEILAELSYRFPRQTARFFMERVELAARRTDFSFRAANHGPYTNKRLRFAEAQDGFEILSDVWRWLLENDDRDHHFQHAAQDMFEAMFLFADQMLVAFLSPKVDRASEAEIKLMGSLLARIEHSFVFENVDFIERLLTRCREFGPKRLRAARSYLFRAAISGMRSGTPGEPMPRDVEDLAQSRKILAKLSRSSAAYELYDDIAKSAQFNIDRSTQEGREMEDE